MAEPQLKFAVIEDIPETNRELTSFLKSHWHDCVVTQLYDYDTAVAALGSTEFDVVVSDVMLGPGGDRLGGLRIAKALDSKLTPLIIVSALEQPEVYSEVFEALGAWDYLEKPILKSAFLKQVELAVAYRQGKLQRDQIAQAEVTKERDPFLHIDFSSKVKVTWKGQRVRLSLTQTRLLDILSSAPNIPVKYDQMFEKIETGRNIENLRVHIMAIRDAFKEVDDTFDRIVSVTMLGYVWRI